MKKAKSPIYLRYEFSDETGTPEGGDVFQYSSAQKVQALVEEILKVTHSDNVAVNLTIGEEGPFFGFLKKVGMSRKEVEKEIVDQSPIAETSGKKTTKKKSKPEAQVKTKAKAKFKKKK